MGGPAIANDLTRSMIWHWDYLGFMRNAQGFQRNLEAFQPERLKFLMHIRTATQLNSYSPMLPKVTWRAGDLSALITPL